MLELAVNNTFVRLIVLALVFAVAVGIVLVIINWIAKRAEASRQLAKLSGSHGSVNQTALIDQERESRWAKIAESIESSGISLTDTSNDKLQQKLKAAGYRSASAPRVYTLVRIILTFGLPAIWLLMVAASSSEISIMRIYVISAIVAGLGFFLPYLFIEAKADRRKTAIINGFPDSLDLLLVCVEAGLGLESALDRVGREIATTHPLVAELFTETTLMMRAGASREDAMRRMADGAGVDEIRSFATLLIQSDKLGTSISNTLRVYASEMREARRLRAEEKAHRLPVLISIPLVTCMLPTMIGVLILPAAIAVIREIGPALTGG
ncbi:type II secretion system F family protein [Qipengyuania sp. 1NDW9]|uniref:type II secretion system F family protein n=1 Tax=Qipengyuania xiapuensis TaxID=2867236 RepID=UPI001C887575|nr:type II secretion system F family protein [Qipengyuania xiapuensis]MBX7494103.1 type II secretion system F family protein [Qipengyuania xiapuensis]